MSQVDLIKDIKTEVKGMIETKFSEMLTLLEARLPEPPKKDTRDAETQLTATTTYMGDHAYTDTGIEQQVTYMVVDNEGVPCTGDITEILGTIITGANPETNAEGTLDDYNTLELQDQGL